MSDPRFVPLPPRHDPGEDSTVAAREFCDVMSTRRSVRMFSSREVPLEAIEAIVRAATWAPSGANQQPWRFVCVSDPVLKSRIRAGAEAEEREFYANRASAQWLADLEPLGTDPNKEFLETAPWLIVVFRLSTGEDGGQVYYSTESVGIACGFLLAAIHHAGLVALTHTPSPMRFLGEILGRPANERPFLLVPVGHPADDCEVPRIALDRRPLSEVMILDRGDQAVSRDLDRNR